MSDAECGAPLPPSDVCRRIARRKICRLDSNAYTNNNYNIFHNDNTDKNSFCWEDSASLNASITTISDVSLSESRFEDYIARYTVAVADFDEYFNKNSHNNNNDDSQPASETESETESKVERAAQTLHEIFVEGCCALYSDLRDSIDDLERAPMPLIVMNSRTADHFRRSGAFLTNVRIADDECPPTANAVMAARDQRELAERLRVLTRQANELAASVPQLADTTQLRLSTLERAMQQLRIRQQQQKQQQKCKQQQHSADSKQPGGVSGAGDMTTPSQRFRKWLQASENELESLKTHIAHASNDIPLLQRLCADHQILQLQIETEGRALLNSAYQQLHVERQAIQSIGDESLPDRAIDHSNSAVTVLLSRAEKRLDRWHRNLEVLEYRWYTHWLASLESLEVVGRLVERLLESENNSIYCSQSELESDGEEPSCKRPRSSLTPTSETEKSSCEEVSRRDKIRIVSKVQSSPMASVMYAANTFSGKTDIATNMIAQLKFSTMKSEMPCREVAITIKSDSSGIEEDVITDQLAMGTSDAEFENELKHVGHCGQQTGKIPAKNGKIIMTRTGNDMSTALSDGGCSRASSSSSSNGAPVSHDVGYSSGENNSLLDGVDAAALLNGTIDTGDLHNSIIKSYYRTVPLDDAGVTDTECGRLLAPSLLASGDKVNHLTDSLIVQVDNNNSFGQSNPVYNNNNIAVGEQESLGRPLDDFEEVMEMMDEQFQTQLELLRRGTQWKELRASNGVCSSSIRRNIGSSGARSPKHKITPPDVSRARTATGSCDASSEESDCNRRALSHFRNAHSLTASLCCPVEAAPPLPTTSSGETPRIIVDAALPDRDDDTLPTDLQTSSPPIIFPALRRKRYHRRSIRNPNNKTNCNAQNTGFATTVVIPVPVHAIHSPRSAADNVQKNASKLKNVLMNQSVYVTGHSDAEHSPDDEMKMTTADELPAVQLGLLEFGKQREVSRKIPHSASDRALCRNALLEQETSTRLMSSSTYENDGRYHHRNQHYHYHRNYHLQPQSEQQHGHCCRCRYQFTAENAGLVRTCSVESCQSSSSSITVHESGDAHFEWDEYKELCDLVMSPSCTEFEKGISATKEKHSTPKRCAVNSTVLNPDATSIISTEDDAFFAAGAAADAQRLLTTRSPPSASDADDSDNEETCEKHNSSICITFEQSRQQLRAVEIALKSVRANLAARKRVVQKNTAHNTHSNTEKLAAASAIANNNIQRLRERSRDAPMLDMDQINELEKLRKSWTRILSKITKMSQRYNKLDADEDTISLSTSDDNNNKNSNNNNGCSGREEKDGYTVSLHSVLEEMKAQLGVLMVCDGGVAPLSLADIEKVVATRKEILSSLLQYRDDLRKLTAEAKQHDTPTTTSSLDRSDVLELVTLMELVEKFLHSIQSSTGSLERLREDFSSLCTLFLSLDAKIERLNHAVSPHSINSEGEPFGVCANFIKTIESELELCQKRMDSLESICNTLSSHFSLAHSSNEEGMTSLPMPPVQSNIDEIPAEPHPPEYCNESASIHASGQVLREFLQYRSELNRLKDRFHTALAQQEPIQPNDALTTPNASPTVSRKRRLNVSSEETRSEQSSHSYSFTSISSDPQIEQTQLTSDDTQTTKITTASVGTQSDISAETVRVYEARLDAVKAARRATRAAKETIDMDAFMQIDGDENKILTCDLKPQRGSSQKLNNGGVDCSTPRCLPQKLRSVLRDSRMAQLCLGCALALAIGMLLLQVFGVTDDYRNPMLINNYRWSFGPQLDYVAGPPPR